MPIICEDIPNTELTKQALFGNSKSLVSFRYVGESNISEIDAINLAPCILPARYKEYAAEIETLKVYEDDVLVASYPRSGTTWTQEMVWLIVNVLDFDYAKKSYIMYRYGSLEVSAVLGTLNRFKNLNSVEYVQAMPRQRLIKTHLPVSLLPIDIWAVKPKLVYVTRNPKDSVISSYHHISSLFGYLGSLEECLDSFLNDPVPYSPFKDHVLGHWKLRNLPKILFITYEDMSKVLNSVLRQVASFFNKKYSDDQFEKLANHLSFNEMKANKACNYEEEVANIMEQLNQSGMPVNFNYKFCRRGQVNSFADEMPAEYQKKFDDWIADKFGDSDLKFNN